jgi:hypothetical protein
MGTFLKNGDCRAGRFLLLVFLLCSWIRPATPLKVSKGIYKLYITRCFLCKTREWVGRMAQSSPVLKPTWVKGVSDLNTPWVSTPLVSGVLWVALQEA